MLAPLLGLMRGPPNTMQYCLKLNLEVSIDSDHNGFRVKLKTGEITERGRSKTMKKG